MTSRLVLLLGTWQPDRAVAASLAERVRALILDGRLTVGERLPSERVLAQELGRSRATITAAYGRLEAAGYVVRTHGGGTHIALPHSSSVRPTLPGSAPIDFSIASTGSAPGLHEATIRALPRLAAQRGGTGYTLEGLDELREVIAARYRDRGVPTDADEIIITSGAMHALALVLAAFSRPGRVAVVEEPTFPHAMDAIRRAGHRLVTTPVTAAGWDVGHLTTTLLDLHPHLAYVIPDFHNPTGANMSDADRSVIAATARSAGTILIVDETCADLDIDRPFTPRPFAAFGDVITLGSLSKIAWGGLRIGWIRASRAVVSRILAVRPTIDLGTAPLEQCIAIELLDDVPALQEHVRSRLAAGRTAVRAGLETIGLTMPETYGGLAVWIGLQGFDSTALSLAAHDHGLRLPPGPRFSASGVLNGYMRLPITLDPETTADGMQRLAQAWQDVHDGPVTHAAMEHLAVV